jgi:hypothetical protein
MIYKMWHKRLPLKDFAPWQRRTNVGAKQQVLQRGTATKRAEAASNEWLLQPQSRHQKESVDAMSWKQRGVVLLSILAVTLVGLAINEARAGEQFRYYGPDGRSIGTAHHKI